MRIVLRILGITAEYNPFHLGHAYHIHQSVLETESSHVAVVMSGNYVQRGVPAICDKWTRARMAISHGADLVLEMPIQYAVSSAEHFALGAVKVFDSLGCIDQISFGSESGDLSDLCELANILTADALLEPYHANYSHSYPASRERAVKAAYGPKKAEILRHPNNILAVEYLKALSQLGSPIKPRTVRRKSSAFLSSSQIRKKIGGDSIFHDAMPPDCSATLLNCLNSGEVFLNWNASNRLVLSKLRCLDPESWLAFPDVSGGLENRLYRAARSAKSVEELYTLAKTKHYTMSRIRRAVLYALLGLTKEIHRQDHAFLSVLALNSKGQEILKVAKQTAAVPIITKPASIKKAASEIQNSFSFLSETTDLYGLLTLNILPCSLEYTKGPFRPLKPT
jgi:predicted nucleotidyltransferase